MTGQPKRTPGQWRFLAARVLHDEQLSDVEISRLHEQVAAALGDHGIAPQELCDLAEFLAHCDRATLARLKMQPGAPSIQRSLQNIFRPSCAMRPRIYISGPLSTSGNERENVAAAVHAARLLIAAGFAPFCPHLSWHIDPAHEIPHGVWMQVDLPWVSMADAVLRLPGESVGAHVETTHAEGMGIPVFETVADLVEHFQAVGTR